MDKKERKRRARQYAKVVIDYANAGTTDDVLSKFFENIQRAFGFSTTFVDEAKKYSPPRQAIESKSVEELVKRCPEEIARGADTIKFYGSIEFGGSIKDSSAEIPKERIEGSPGEIARVFSMYVEDLHQGIQFTQKDLRVFLEDVSQKKKPRDCTGIELFLAVYNRLSDRFSNTNLEVEETGDLVKMPVYDEQDYLEDFRTGISTTRLTGPFRSGRHLNPFDTTLAHCIFEFLINPAGWHLKKCNQCGKFFIADHGNSKRCDRDFCRRKAAAAKKSKYRAKKKTSKQRLS